MPSHQGSQGAGQLGGQARGQHRQHLLHLQLHQLCRGVGHVPVKQGIVNDVPGQPEAAHEGGEGLGGAPRHVVPALAVLVVLPASASASASCWHLWQAPLEGLCPVHLGGVIQGAGGNEVPWLQHAALWLAQLQAARLWRCERHVHLHHLHLHVGRASLDSSALLHQEAHQLARHGGAQGSGVVLAGELAGGPIQHQAQATGLLLGVHQVAAPPQAHQQAPIRQGVKVRLHPAAIAGQGEGGGPAEGSVQAVLDRVIDELHIVLHAHQGGGGVLPALQVPAVVRPPPPKHCTGAPHCPHNGGEHCIRLAGGALGQDAGVQPGGVDAVGLEVPILQQVVQVLHCGVDVPPDGQLPQGLHHVAPGVLPAGRKGEEVPKLAVSVLVHAPAAVH